MKHQISCLSCSPRAVKWLSDTKHAQVLHRFPEVLNLINEHREVFSIVVPAVGNGPFSAVIDAEQLNGLFGGEGEIGIEGNCLMFGDTMVSFDSTEMWDPIPDWEVLAAVEKADLIRYIEEQFQSAPVGEGMAEVFSAVRRRNNSGSKFVTSLRKGSVLILDGLTNDDAAKVKAGTAVLAGLGVGLTPTGDDFLMGVMYGLRATNTWQKAEELSFLIYAEAAGRTTTLSAAWLEAARHGEAGEKWHALLRAVGADQADALKESIGAIMHTGGTSGADALTGFVQVLKLEKRR